MTDPKENEDINEELSTDELKNVSGGLSNADFTGATASNFKSPKGSGSGMKKGDYQRYTRTDSQADGSSSF